ncbi:unnamed protein product [Lymnaea stagnalis]|uniref:Uncharacterized protein n=1 Tax=Lymnaea stagnalis TaxID=6523 RepID=A0AAV2HVN2_LYMST
MNLEDWHIVEKKGAELNYLIATELMTTERDYVARLHILYNIFYVELEKENKFSPFLPDNALPLIFSNIKSIYLFHKDFILPQLEERITHWSSDQRVGDIMKKNAPFLKIYGEFVHNFRTAVKNIEVWRRKSSRFSEIVHRLEQLPECERLPFQNLLIEPVQRLVRYELLLKEYVRVLSEDSPDLHDSQEALVLVSKAALHSNEALKKLEVFKKKLEIYQKLRGVPQDFITPTRHLLAHGPVTEISTKKGEKHPRHLFLFNDLILVCTENKSTDTYSVWKSLGIEGLKVTPFQNSLGPNTFEVGNKQGACLLLDQNLTGASFDWEQKIKTILNAYLRKKIERLSACFDLDNGPSSEEKNDSECQIGQVRPVHVSDSAITKCMICEETFGLVRRKQNCMACGKLMCRSCSRKASLQYKQGKKETVCLGCFDAITRDTRPNLSTAVLFDDTDSHHSFSQA